MISAAGMGLVGACLLANGPADGELLRCEFRQTHMGVPFHIVLYAPDEPSANRAASRAFARIAALDAILSDYKGDSELNRLCRTSGPDRPVPVSPELFLVLSRADDLARRTGGAFDVTVGPVVKLWRRARRRKQMPEPKRLAEARSLVDYRSVRLDPQSRTVTLHKESMRLDLGGIAKGYACDEALAVLRSAGIDRALIDGGGDIALGKAPPGRGGWRIEIAPLGPSDEAPRRAVCLHTCAVATSGDLYQSVTIDGIRYSHIVDPKTGLGLQSRSSVTVIAADCITADSVASAVSVLGRDRGLQLIASQSKLAALIVEQVDDVPRSAMSPKMALLLDHPPAADCGGSAPGLHKTGRRP